MTKAIGILVCLLIIALDVVAGILGIEAEIHENQVKNLTTWVLECKDPSYEAFKLGLLATILLVLAHGIASSCGGCFYFRSKAEFNAASSNRQLAATSLVFSWLILVIAFLMLLVGTATNAKPRRSCGLAHHSVLSIGGILCFIHGLCAVSYYLFATAATREEQQTTTRSTPA